MKAKVTYLSKSGKSAILAVKQPMGPIMQNVSGFVSLPEGHKMEVGQELEIPATKCKVVKRQTEDGEQEFDWLEFE